MPKRKDVKDAKDAGQKSDVDILKERRSSDAFGAADNYLGVIGWGLWALAAVWLFCFSPAAPGVSDLHGGVAEPLLGLLVCGSACGALAGCSPRGAWSAWRQPWHLGWSAAFGLLAAAFGWAGAPMAPQLPRGSPAPPGMAGALLAGSCGLAAVGAVLTFPAGAPKPARGVGFTVSRALCAADGAAGLIVGALVAARGPWSEPLGPALVCVQVVPLAMFSLAMLLCQTEAELLAAVPQAMLLLAGASARSALAGELLASVPAAAALVAHLALYLPLPAKDPDSNPFNRALRKKIERFARFMQQPVSGFGEDGE